MSHTEEYATRVEEYLARHAATDLEGVVALFEPDAIVEDPVGSEIYAGLEAIRAFYAATHKTHRANGRLTIERVGPMLFGMGTEGEREVALHVRAGLRKPGNPPPMDVIYTIRFAPSGRIESLRAWF